MNSIDLMIEEHKYIKRMLIVIRKYCFNVLKGREIPYDDFYKIIEFVRNFADKHHHGKEEDFLFNKMIEHQGQLAEKLVKHGMLVEHDFGRLYMTQLEEALEKVKSGDEEAKLDIIANAIGYADLLNRHIDKEDNVVYNFALNGLNKEILDSIDIKCQEFEQEAADIRNKYIKILEELEKKITK